MIETFINVVDHFSVLVKAKKLHQSTYTFNRMMKSFQLIFPTLHQIAQPVEKEAEQIDKLLRQIGREMDDENFIKISKIVQFSLRPSANQLLHSFIKTAGDHKKETTTKIGLFHHKRNPLELLTAERIRALNKEAEKQKATLYYFTSNDIDFHKKQMKADTIVHGERIQVKIPYPDVVYHIAANGQNFEERKLKREVPFTSYFTGHTYTLPQKLAQHKKYMEYLLPFTTCLTKKNVYRFLTRNETVVFKRINRKSGENIFFVQQEDSGYVVSEHEQRAVMTADEFEQFINDTILAQKGTYIVQRYLFSRTSKDEPFHIRVHVQKNEHGIWVISFMYVMIGKQNDFVSNGCKTKNVTQFLKEQYGAHWQDYYEKITTLSVDVSMYVDERYNFGLDELGMKYGIDEEGNVWVYEVNNAPDKKQFEEKRAVHTIAYAKYIAQGGFTYTDFATKRQPLAGQFNASKSTLPVATKKHRMNVAILTSEQTEPSSLQSFFEAAVHKNMQLYYFTRKDIDYELKLIRVSYFEHGKWVQKVTEYPDVVIDLLKLRGHKSVRMLYEELSDVQFLNNIPFHYITKERVYRKLQDDYTIESFEKVARTRDVFTFLERYNSVFLYANTFGDRKEHYEIHKFDDRYFFKDERNVEEHSTFTLRHEVNNLVENRSFLVQRDTRYKLPDNRLLSFHVDLVKNGNHWIVLYEEAVLTYANRPKKEVYALDELLHELHLPDPITQKINDDLHRTVIEIAKEYESNEEYNVNELFLNVSINNKGEFCVLELEPYIHHEVADDPLYVQATLRHAEQLFSSRN